MAKKIVKWIAFFLLFMSVEGSLAFTNDKITMILRTDMNKDGKKELLVHDYFGGTGALGELRIYNSKKHCIFKQRVEADTYLWDAKKHICALDPCFFPDINQDGLVEIIVGHCVPVDGISHVDYPWWYDVYAWNGKNYVLANAKFPGFFRDQLKYYADFVKKKGESRTIKQLIVQAKEFANN